MKLTKKKNPNHKSLLIIYIKYFSNTKLRNNLQRIDIQIKYPIIGIEKINNAVYIR